MILKMAPSRLMLLAAVPLSLLMPEALSPIVGKQAHAKPAPAPAASPAKRAATPAEILQLSGTLRFVGDAKSARGTDLDGYGVSFEGGRVRAFYVELDGTISALSTPRAPFRAMSAKELTDAWFNANFGFLPGTPLHKEAPAKFAEARKQQVGNALFLPDRNLPDDGGAELFINTKSGKIYYFDFGGFGQFTPLQAPAKAAKK
jgi:hypothetical protein